MKIEKLEDIQQNNIQDQSTNEIIIKLKNENDKLNDQNDSKHRLIRALQEKLKQDLSCNELTEIDLI